MFGSTHRRNGVYPEGKRLSLLSKWQDYLLAYISQQIISQLKTLDSGFQNTAKLSRWIRCLFQLALDSDSDIAESVLDQAHMLARDKNGQLLNCTGTGEVESEDSYYPDEELEWLCTTSFNKAVDFYISSNDSSSRRWAQKAIEIAGFMNDKGLLYRILREKFEKLTWDH